MGYTISFFINGYGQQPESLNNVSNLPELPQLEEEGFIFDGWFLDEDLTVPAEVGMEITSDITLYAAWSRSRVGWGAVGNEATTYAYFENDFVFDGGGGGGSGSGNTGTITANYYNKPGYRTPHTWITTSTATVWEDLYNLHTFTNFKDSAENPIRGLLVPGVNPTTGVANTLTAHWMSDTSSNAEHMKDGNFVLNCIKKGRMPAITVNPGYANTGNKAGSFAPTTGVSAANYVPFWSTTTAGTYTLTRTDSSLTIGSSTFSASDFRDGVIPEVLYIIIQGAGGGGGGTTLLQSAGGGGSGALAAAVVVLKDNNPLHPGQNASKLVFTVGTGGAGGYSTTYNGACPGGNGGDTRMTYYVDFKETATEGYSTGDIWAGGGKGGDRGDASGKTTSNCAGDGSTYTSFSEPYFYWDNDGNWEYGEDEYVFICKLSVNGARGGDKGEVGGVVAFSTFTTCDIDAKFRPSSNAYHNKVMPNPKLAGSCTSNGGGGAGSYLGDGGRGGISSSTQANNHGGAGHSGSGGGGAQYYTGRYNRGGKGGDGAVYIFY